MFDADQNLLHASYSVLSLQHLGGRFVVEHRERRGKPVTGLVLITEYSHRMGDHRHKAGNIGGFGLVNEQIRHTSIQFYLDRRLRGCGW